MLFVVVLNNLYVSTPVDGPLWLFSELLLLKYCCSNHNVFCNLYPWKESGFNCIYTVRTLQKRGNICKHNDVTSHIDRTSVNAHFRSSCELFSKAFKFRLSLKVEYLVHIYPITTYLTFIRTYVESTN